MDRAADTPLLMRSNFLFQRIFHCINNKIDKHLFLHSIFLLKI